MKQWQLAWRNHIAPRLPERGLVALADELARGGGNLVSHAFLKCEDDKAVCGCAIGYAVWHGSETSDANVVSRAITELVRGVGDDGVTSPLVEAFTTHFDAKFDENRDGLIAELLPEVERAIVMRLAEDVVTLSDEWWGKPNPAFGGISPWDDLVTFGREKVEGMLWQIIGNVAN